MVEAVDGTIARETQAPQDSVSLSFVDFLFTLAIAFGFAGQDPTKPGGGLLAERWIIAGQFPSSAQTVELLTFFLGVLTLALSWYGYHDAVSKRKSIKPRSFWSMTRFVIDVVLILLYGLMLVEYQHVAAVMFLIVLIYALYLLWDVLVILGYTRSERASVKYRGEVVAVVAVGVAIALYFINVYTSFSSLALIIIAIIGSFCYRLANMKLRTPPKDLPRAAGVGVTASAGGG